jgi:hypothetical protein
VTHVRKIARLIGPGGKYVGAISHFSVRFHTRHLTGGRPVKLKNREATMLLVFLVALFVFTFLISLASGTEGL